MEGETEMKELKLKTTHVCIFLFVVLGVFNVQSFHAPLSDFGNYYYGSDLFAFGGGNTDQLTAVAPFNSYAESHGAQNVFLNYGTVSPQTTLFYIPFAAVVDPLKAKHLFNWLGILVFVFSLYRFLQHFRIETGWKQVALLVAAIIPLYYNILFGQTYLIITALIIESILQSEKRPWLSGLFLGIAIALKISPAVLCIWFIAEKKYRVVLWAVLSWLLISAATLLLHPDMWNCMVAFYTEAFPRISSGFISDPYSSSFQGFVVFLRKLMLPDAVLHPAPLINGTEKAVQLINLIFYIIIAVFAVGAWKRAAEWKQKILLLLLVANITSGYTSTYSLLLLVPFITLENTTRGWIKVLLYGIVFCFPPRIFDGTSPFLEEYKLWIFIALFIIECKPSFSFRTLEKPQLVVGVFFLATVLLKTAQRPEQMPLNYYRPDLIHQHYVLNAYPRGDRMLYLSYADGGFHEFSVNITPEWQNTGMYKENIHGVNFYVVAGSTNDLLVLSDYHRGPGLLHLYTIHKADYEALKRK